VTDREPDFKPIEIFREEDDGQLSIEPVEDEGLDLGAWMERMPRDDQYRTLSRALGRPW
jgi:hypothetical protein